MGPATSTTASSHESRNIIAKVSTASNCLRENHSWHHVIKCRAVVEYENEVKSHANTHTHTHTQSSTVVIIYAIIGSERETIRDNTKNQGYMIVYIIYAWAYVCNFCTLTLTFFVFTRYLG